jgi:hypothetical protein
LSCRCCSTSRHRDSAPNPRETVIAEKFQSMVVLGRANSRMKDDVLITQLMDKI